ncbi:hypothetical protein ACFQ0M_03655 [Kitasatospora aburaviensis]
MREALARADLVLLNLECCVSARGARRPSPFKAFFFRARPRRPTSWPSSGWTA